MTVRQRAQIIAGTAACALLAWPAHAHAVGKDRTPLDLPAEGKEPASLDGGAMLLKTGMALAITIGVIYCLYRALKLMGDKTPGQRSGAITVLSRTRIDKELQVLILAAGDRVIVVGRTQHGLQSLENISREQAEQQGLTSSVDDDADHRLRGVLTDITARLKPQKPAARSIDELLDGEGA